MNSKSIFNVQSYKTFNNFLLGNGGEQSNVYKNFGYISDIYLDNNVFDNLSKKEIIERFAEQDLYFNSLNKLSTAEKNNKYA